MHPRGAVGGLALFLMAGLYAVLLAPRPTGHPFPGKGAPADAAFQAPGPDDDVAGSAADDTGGAATPSADVPPAPAAGIARVAPGPRIGQHSPRNSPSRAPPPAV